MPIPVDLHIHSSFSDGTLSPKEIVTRARKLGLEAISITDHDTTDGLHESLDLISSQGPKIIPGVELSAHHHLASVHILGYGIDRNCKILQKKLEKIQAARENRNISILRKLETFGFPLSLAEIAKNAQGQVGRPHIASMMVKKGIVNNENEAFVQFLRKDAKAYAERELLPAEEAIDTIIQAGGVAALAHPASVDPTCSFISKLIEDLLNKGLEAIEVYHPIHNKKHIDYFSRICREMGLLITGGSDFHGRNRDRTELGRYAPGKLIPNEVYTELLKIISAKKVTKTELRN